MESVNFVHDVNVLRKTLKSVYSGSADLKALNSELGAGHGNCRVQVLPVCWRHLIEFPRRRQKTGEHDLGDVAGEEDDCKCCPLVAVPAGANQYRSGTRGHYCRGRRVCAVTHLRSRAGRVALSELLPRGDFQNRRGRDESHPETIPRAKPRVQRQSVGRGSRPRSTGTRFASGLRRTDRRAS